MGNSRIVKYERSIIAYVDILGFRDLIASKSADDVARYVRVVHSEISPRRFKISDMRVPVLDFRGFSDLCVIRRSLTQRNGLQPIGAVHSLILHLVHAQTILAIDEGILLRGGVTVGDVGRSRGQLFGPALIRAYELECEVAKFPRIVVGDEVFDEVKQNPFICTHNPEDELQFVKHLLRRDCDGEYFVDYLRVIHGELDKRTEYTTILDRHKQLIKDGLKKYTSCASILQKYKWLREYHRNTLNMHNRQIRSNHGPTKKRPFLK